MCNYSYACFCHVKCSGPLPETLPETLPESLPKILPETLLETLPEILPKILPKIPLGSLSLGLLLARRGERVLSGLEKKRKREVDDSSEKSRGMLM